jgi:hypothetical protein
MHEVLSHRESETANTFSLAGEGSLRKYFRWFGFGGGSSPAGRIALWFALTWFPLALLCIVDGTAWGHRVRIPLFHDFSVYGRFFVALPILVIADRVIDRFVRRAVLIFDSSGILRNGDLFYYRAALEKVFELRDSRIIDVILVLLAFVPFFLFLTGNEWTSGMVSTWHGSRAQGLSLGGWWFVVASSPVLRYLMLRWLWRFALWTYVLRKVSSLNLYLIPMHPDRLGGLGFLLFAQEHFGLLAAALGSVIAGQFANEIFYLGQPLREIKAPAGLFIFGSILIVLLPLGLFSFRLFEARYDGIIRNNRVARLVTAKFDAKWVRKTGSPPDQMIGTQDPSSLIDYISSYEVIKETRIVPISKRAVIYVAAFAGAPFAFVWLLTTPVEGLVTEILKRLF